ncbi:hypothetical protein [[Haemophilus] ducreyi]|uniref:hypothetical protein n=1 Tax=Haemophilus ducreyi TaxID=730 RepID=UPI00065528B9|nr:hypothetical protein [[Haemophilus] ducreyi]AKO45035.1 hypothetical protein RZ66_01760 [[Haemophilus] ducreyi]AKO46437.1 hypothetical protein RZ67_01735 [[Haemophilus] ducreyi]VEG83234.1 LpsA [[Haemophilus] ducreyi]
MSRKLYKLNGIDAGTASYIVTKIGIEYLLSRLDKLEALPIDMIIFKDYLKDSNYIVWMLLPSVGIQDFLLNSKEHFESALKIERDIHNSKALEKSKIKINILAKIYREILRPFKRLKKAFFLKKVRFK